MAVRHGRLERRLSEPGRTGQVVIIGEVRGRWQKRDVLEKGEVQVVGSFPCDLRHGRLGTVSGRARPGIVERNREPDADRVGAGAWTDNTTYLGAHHHMYIDEEYTTRFGMYFDRNATYYTPPYRGILEP